MELPRVARCVPGVESIEVVDASAYRGSLKIQIGPIRLVLQGTMTVVERDRSVWRARMRAESNDRRLGGGIRARMSLTLAPGRGGARRQIATELDVRGKRGRVR